MPSGLTAQPTSRAETMRFSCTWPMVLLTDSSAMVATQAPEYMPQATPTPRPLGALADFQPNCLAAASRTRRRRGAETMRFTCTWPVVLLTDSSAMVATQAPEYMPQATPTPRPLGALADFQPNCLAAASRTRRRRGAGRDRKSKRLNSSHV